MLAGQDAEQLPGVAGDRRQVRPVRPLRPRGCASSVADLSRPGLVLAISRCAAIASSGARSASLAVRAEQGPGRRDVGHRRRPATGHDARASRAGRAAPPTLRLSRLRSASLVDGRRRAAGCLELAGLAEREQQRPEDVGPVADVRIAGQQRVRSLEQVDRRTHRALVERSAAGHREQPPGAEQVAAGLGELGDHRATTRRAGRGAVPRSRRRSDGPASRVRSGSVRPAGPRRSAGAGTRTSPAPARPARPAELPGRPAGWPAAAARRCRWLALRPHSAGNGAR